MEEIYVWEFWFSDSIENKRIWYLEEDDWEYKLIISEGFSKKTKWGVISWKSTYIKDINWIINWKIINKNELMLWYKYISLIWLSAFDLWLDIKEYSFKYLIFWFNFNERKDICFNSFEFMFDWLSEFIWKGSFNIKQINNTWWNILNPDTVIVDINKDYSIIKIGKYDWLELSFVNRWNLKTLYEHYTVRNKCYQLLNSININNNYFIKVSPTKNNITLDKIEDLIVNFQRFFSLIFGEDIKIENISIKKEIFFSKKQIEFLETKKKSHVDDIEIIFNQWFIAKNNKKSLNKRENKEILFHLSEVKFLDVISNFINNAESKFKTIYNLYYATLQNKGLHLENVFLNLIQSIEWMYYNSGLPLQNIIKEKEEELLGKILKLKLSKHDNKILKILNEKSLSQKLKELSKYLWIEFKLDWDDIKNKIEKIRNCFSHWWDREDFVNLDLFKIIILLKIVLELFIIKELWIEESLYSSIKDYKINTELKLEIW